MTYPSSRLVVASVLLITAWPLPVQAQPTTVIDVLECDEKMAEASRSRVTTQQGQQVAAQLTGFGVSNAAAQAKFVLLLGDRAVDLSKIDGARVNRLLSGASGGNRIAALSKPAEIEVQYVLKGSEAIPAEAMFSARGANSLNAATLEGVRNALQERGVNRVFPSQLRQLLVLNARNDGLAPALSPLATSTVAVKILANRTSVLGPFTVNTFPGRSDVPTGNAPYEKYLNDLRTGGGGLTPIPFGFPRIGRGSAEQTGQTGEGRNTGLDNFNAVPTDKRASTPPNVDTTPDDKGCDASLKAFSAALLASPKLYFFNKDEVKSLEDFAKWKLVASAFDLELAKAARVASEQVSANCLAEISTVQAQVPPNLDVRRFVGAIGGPGSPDSKDPQIRKCTATLISADVILTARHCVMLPDQASKKPVEMMPLAMIQTHWFEIDAGEPFRYQICGIKHSPKLAKPSDYASSNDWVTLQIAAPVRGRVAPVKLSRREALVGATLLIPAVNPLAPQNTTQIPLSTTKVSGCSVLASSSDCLFHNCQTLPSMSGAPVFHEQAGDLLFLGLHLGQRAGDWDAPAIPPACGDPIGQQDVKFIRNVALKAAAISQ